MGDHLEKPELLGHLEKRVKKDPQDLLDIQEGQVIKETKVLKEGMVHLVEKEKGVRMVFKEKEVKLDQEDSQEELEYQVQREIQVNLGPRVQWASKELLVQKGQEVHLGRLVFREFLVKMVSLVHLVQLGNLVRLESPVFLELLVCLENLVDLVNQEKKDLQVPLVPKADLAYQVHLVCQDSPEKEVFLDFRECLA